MHSNMLNAVTSVYAFSACLLCGCTRLDKSVNTLTTERALLGLVALWNRVPFSTSTWSFFSLLGLQTIPDNALKSDVEEFFEDFFEDSSHRRHMGVLEGTSLADVIISADESFDWSSLPAKAGAWRSTSTDQLRLLGS
jgi:hypothetical protein